jgi:asparagine synthase (glutamine-hydrolysing)
MTPNKDRLIDLSRSEGNWTPGMTEDECRSIVRSGNVSRIGEIPGHFAFAEREGRTVRMARTLGKPLRYLVAKRLDGPFLIVADTMKQIWDFCHYHRIEWQFDPSYTRLVPAHYLVEIDQIGCPDPNPRYHRFFKPEAGGGPADVDALGQRYISAVHDGLRTWLWGIPEDEPIGITLSGGVDSTSVLILARHALKEMGSDPDRIRPLTLEMEGGGPDGRQAREVLVSLGIAGGEIYQVTPDDLDLRDAIETMEDYQPLDVQCAASLIALLRAVRERHPDLTYLLDGDGSDENMRAYPIEDTELTMKSVLRNPLLYVEGWGVDAIKHSLTYSGGLSRSVVRTWAPMRRFGFDSFSPYTLRPVIQEAMAAPLRALIGEDPERLYRLKGRVVRAGVMALTGIDMPVRTKRRFQEGLTGRDDLAAALSCTKEACRSIFRKSWEGRIQAALAHRKEARVLSE